MLGAFKENLLNQSDIKKFSIGASLLDKKIALKIRILIAMKDEYPGGVGDKENEYIEAVKSYLKSDEFKRENIREVKKTVSFTHDNKKQDKEDEKDMVEMEKDRLKDEMLERALEGNEHLLPEEDQSEFIRGKGDETRFGGKARL